jgi:hypothetical protein
MPGDKEAPAMTEVISRRRIRATDTALREPARAGFRAVRDRFGPD